MPMIKEIEDSGNLTETLKEEEFDSDYMNSSLDEQNDKNELLSPNEKYDWSRINHILVVEENAISFEMIQNNLKSLNINEKSSLCTKGERAIEFVSDLLSNATDCPISVIILAKEMQKMSGRELVQ